MKVTIILSLASSSLAVPFSNVINTIFSNAIQTRHGLIPAPDVPVPSPPGYPNWKTKHAGTGPPTHKTKKPHKPTGKPCATGTGFIWPIASSGYMPVQSHASSRSYTKLSVSYGLAPTSTATPTPVSTPPMPINTPPASPSSANDPWSSYGSPDFPDASVSLTLNSVYPSGTGVHSSGSGGYGYGGHSTMTTAYVKPTPTPYED